MSVTAGLTVSMTKVLALLAPVLPAPSAWLACAVYVPSAPSELLGATDQVPPDSVVVTVVGDPQLMVEPGQILTVTVVESALLVVLAATCPALPEKVGRFELTKPLFAGVARVTIGLTVSMTKVSRALPVPLPVLPATSPCRTWAVYWAFALRCRRGCG